MLPIENSTYGRIADIHHLLPESGLHIVGEHFVRVHANLLAVPGTRLEEVKTAMSQAPLLGQVRGFLREHGIAPRPGPDTAGSAAAVAEAGDPSVAALASELAGEIHGLEVLARHIEDQQNNTTRFLVMAPEPRPAAIAGALTTFVFRVRNLPAALYKAMGGFATNGVNMTKLESYMVERPFHRHAVLCRHRGASGRAAGGAGAGGAPLLHHHAAHSRGLSPQRVPPGRCGAGRGGGLGAVARRHANREVVRDAARFFCGDHDGAGLQRFHRVEAHEVDTGDRKAAGLCRLSGRASVAPGTRSQLKSPV